MFFVSPAQLGGRGLKQGRAPRSPVRRRIARSVGRARIETGSGSVVVVELEVSPAQLGGRGLKPARLEARRRVKEGIARSVGRARIETLQPNPSQIQTSSIARSVGRARIETVKELGYCVSGLMYRPLSWAGAD